jgi:hypothetical protein
MLEAGGASRVSAWAIEREARAAEAAKLKATIAELQQKHTDTKRRVNEAEASVEAGRKERAQLEQWFKRQVGTRTAAVEEARSGVRDKQIAIARRALLDRDLFGAGHDPSREQIATLERAAESAARDVKVHLMALEAYDPKATRLGGILAAVIALVLIVVPIVWRATRVIEPPIVPIPPPAKTVK